MVSIDENFTPEYKVCTKIIEAQFNLPKLKKMLKQYSEFPDKYRVTTWQFLLQLPSNKDAFENLLARGIHPAYKNLHKKYRN